MNFLILSIPIILIILSLIVVFVLSTDSNKHLKNLDTNNKLKLERLRELALEEVNKIKNINTNKKTSLVEKNNEYQKNILNKLNVEKENRLGNYSIDTINKNKVSNVTSNKNSKKIIFTKKNIVRGIIAREYFLRVNK
ncbi:MULTISPECIES: hypothetical protein [unclassified Gemella]|uniref:hypothetical protein n=1 Tax=unclassified Gemella TaxID=2624949 RepID=UPI001C03DF64|nr:MULTISPECIES: hypothetical protein [unclassified Gemella]MBU0278108.1 hypothetical protein [Gemella sp. zg-1178]QWQ38367.1 hypothetical protein KMP11_05245 [Gemella sp. zg-570]